MKTFNKAFTMAEVLLVVAIVGVVAVLTITNAVNENDEAERILQLRRAVSIIETGLAQAVNEEGPLSNCTSSYDGGILSCAQDKFFKKLKLTKDCGTSTGCWKDGDEKLDSSKYYIKAILSNGSAIAVNDVFEIYIDANGPQKGNSKNGVDVFKLDVMPTDGYILPLGTTFYSDNSFREFCNQDQLYCTAWALKNGNTDYLKCIDDLSWKSENGNKTCPK